jgi:hypothetical protein
MITLRTDFGVPPTTFRSCQGGPRAFRGRLAAFGYSDGVHVQPNTHRGARLAKCYRDIMGRRTRVCNGNEGGFCAAGCWEVWELA